MPRPKRIKVAPSAPARRGRKPAKPTTAEEKAPGPKDGFNDMYDVSDPDEGIVASVRHVKKNNGKGRAIDTLQLKSRVPDAVTRDDNNGEGEITGNALEAAHGSPSIPGERTLLEYANLDSSSPDVELGRRDRSTIAAERSLLIGNFRRQPREPSNLGRTARRARSSSVESNLAEENGLTSVVRKNTSALGIGNFKRRKREPSVLGRNIGSVRSSSIGLEMDRGTPAVGSALKLGNFKRRAREPSILGTGQKTQQPRPEYDDEDEDDFNPEDESTPLNLSKTRTTTSPTASGSNPRKRKLSLVQAPASSPASPSVGNCEEQEIVPATAPLNDDPEEEGEAPSETEAAPMPSIEAFTPGPLSETMAPPQSSSPTPDTPSLPRPSQRIQSQQAPSRGRRALRSKTPLQLNQDSPPSSPPSLTHSPNGPVRAAPKPRAKRQRPPTSTFSTAQLQALLPRRRRRETRDPFDLASSEDEVDVSGLASDDDELTNTSIRAPPRRSILNRLPTPLRKPSKPKAGTKAKGKATYSRLQTTSDKENEENDPDDSLGPLPDDGGGGVSSENSQELEKRVGKELKRAARKFKEVDEWELDFEDNTASSSSPKDAR